MILRVLLVGLTTCVTVSLSQNLPLPPLLYPYDALVPYFDETTMRIHHLKHHDGYRKKINVALATLRSDPETKHLAKMGIYELLSELDKVPLALVNTVRNNGGGFVNHADFFESLAESGNGGGGDTSFISLELQKALVSTFESYEGFQSSFKAAALGRFGSGWAYLYYDKTSNKVRVASYPNQDCPQMIRTNVPLLGFDVWEHAYYLNYQNRRDEYVDAFFHIVNWTKVSDRFAVASTPATLAIDDL